MSGRARPMHTHAPTRASGLRTALRRAPGLLRRSVRSRLRRALALAGVARLFRLELWLARLDRLLARPRARVDRLLDTLRVDGIAHAAVEREKLGIAKVAAAVQQTRQ